MITDLCLMEPDPVSRELIVTEFYPGVAHDDVEKQCGWPVRFAAQPSTTTAPTALELKVLRELHARTKAAHGGDA